MTERIQNAINILLDAINEGTLGKGDCRACAVGNLVAHGLGGKITYNHNDSRFACTVENNSWVAIFATNSSHKQRFSPERIYLPIFKNAVKCIEATDFTVEELVKIEYSFETNTKISAIDYNFHTQKEIKQDQIKGLEAVVKVMMEFDDVQADIKEVFTDKIEPVKI